jgi:hypothetical protein
MDVKSKTDSHTCMEFSGRELKDMGGDRRLSECRP